MKKILLATVAVLGMAGVASAADLPARMPVKAPPIIAPVFSWTGCYIGGYVGGAWADGDVSAYDRSGYNAVGAWGYKTDSSFIGGGTLGCNWQPVGSPWVLGLEGEVGYLHLSGSAADPRSPALDTVSSTKIGDWYGIIAGRFGYSWDRTLIYVKGGAAFVDVQNSILDACSVGACGGARIGASSSNTTATWTVGGGLEWAFDMNWSVKAEYMYIALSDQSVCGVASGTLSGTRCWDHDDNGIHTAKIGINYRFGGGKAPVVARY